MQSSVDRARRFFFVTRLIAFCLISGLLLIVAVGFGFLSPAVHLVELYISGLLGTATAVALAYITGSVVDYNGGIGNMIRGQPETTKIELPRPSPDVEGDGARG